MFKTELLKARCTPAERAALLRIAECEIRTPSETLRELVRREAQARGLWPVDGRRLPRMEGNHARPAP